MKCEPEIIELLKKQNKTLKELTNCVEYLSGFLVAYILITIFIESPIGKFMLSFF